MSRRKKNPTDGGETPEHARERLAFLRVLGQALTPEVHGKVRAFAVDRVRMTDQAGVSDFVGLADDLVADAVAVTAKGTRSWNPAKCALSTHLCGIIRNRTHRAVARRYRVPVVPLPEESPELATVESAEAGVVRAQVVDRFLTALRDAARQNEDDELIEMIDVYASGSFKRRDVVAEMGITPRRHDTLRGRLQKLLLDLPADIRDEAIDVMRNGE